MIVFVPIVIFISSVLVIYLFFYCKNRNPKSLETRMFKNPFTQVNGESGSRRLGSRRSIPSVYLIPTTNQVMQMYIQHAVQNAATRSTTVVSEEFKSPPDYGQVMVEIPPTYEEAVGRESRNGV